MIYILLMKFVPSKMRRLEDYPNIPADLFYKRLLNRTYHPIDAVRFVAKQRLDLEETLDKAMMELWETAALYGMNRKNMRELLECYRSNIGSKTKSKIRVGNDIVVLNNYYESIMDYNLRL